MAQLKFINVVSIFISLLLAIFFTQGARFMPTESEALSRYVESEWKPIYQEMLKKSASEGWHDSDALLKAFTLRKLGHSGCVADSATKRADAFWCFHKQAFIGTNIIYLWIVIGIIAFSTGALWHYRLADAMLTLSPSYPMKRCMHYPMKKPNRFVSAFAFWPTLTLGDKVLSLVHATLLTLGIFFYVAT